MTGKSRRGFASMSPERRSAIARMGAAQAAANGTAHRWDKAEAQAAGKKGGTAISQAMGPAHMAQLGKLGGASRARQRAAQRADAAAGGVSLA